MKTMIKNHALTIIISALLALSLVITFIATIGNKMCFCSCGALYDIIPTMWGYMPLHYHLKGDNWNKLPEIPESYFEETEEEGVFMFHGRAGGDVKIPDTINGKPVKCVSFNKACWNVTGVYFPNGVTAIPEKCFERNDNISDYYWSRFEDSFIENVFLPDSVTEIGAYAFAGTSLKSIAVPGSVTGINEGTFESCASLESADLGNNVTVIGKNAFNNCTSLSSADIGGSLIEIGENAFSNCTNLSSVVLPDSVTTIGSNAFLNCASLTEVTIPDSVTTIDETAFNYCNNIKATYKGKVYDYDHLPRLYAEINKN